MVPVHPSSAAVPVAFSEAGGLVRPERARRAARYRCPGCGAELVLRRGERRRPHFAHRGGEGCSPESALHRAAKSEVVRVVSEWKAGSGPAPCISRPCPVYGCEGGIVQDLPADVTRAAEEVRLPEGAVADVVLFRGEVPAVAIEIRATHRVSTEKAARLRTLWMELRAEDVLERPYWWVVARDGLLPFVCPECEDRGAEDARLLAPIRRRAEAAAERLGTHLPPTPQYDSVAHTCWRCGVDMLVFFWSGAGPGSARRPPDPVPRSVRYRATEGSGDYWTNCCPRCSAVQGEYFLARDNADYGTVRSVRERGARPYG